MLSNYYTEKHKGWTQEQIEAEYIYECVVPECKVNGHFGCLTYTQNWEHNRERYNAAWGYEKWPEVKI